VPVPSRLIIIFIPEQPVPAFSCTLSLAISLHLFQSSLYPPCRAPCLYPSLVTFIPEQPVSAFSCTLLYPSLTTFILEQPIPAFSCTLSLTLSCYIYSKTSCTLVLVHPVSVPLWLHLFQDILYPPSRAPCLSPSLVTCCFTIRPHCLVPAGNCCTVPGHSFGIRIYN
jgi:hypothetical protein